MDKFTGVRCRPAQSARLIQVIEVESTAGTGDEEDPVRCVTQYYATDGTLLAEVDPMAEHHAGNSSGVRP